MIEQRRIDRAIDKEIDIAIDKAIERRVRIASIDRRDKKRRYK